MQNLSAIPNEKLLDTYLDHSQVKLNKIYETLCKQTTSKQLRDMFFMDGSLIYKAIHANVPFNGTWCEHGTYAHVGQQNSIILTQPRMTITLHGTHPIPYYDVSDDDSLVDIVTDGLIPLFKSILVLLNIELIDDTVTTEILETFQDHLKQQIPIKIKASTTPTEPAYMEPVNALPANLLAAKFSNPVRVGKGRRHSKRELVDALKPFVEDESALASIYLPEDALWSRLKTVRLETIDFDTDDAIIVPIYTEDSKSIEAFKLVIKDWHIVLERNNTKVNSIYSKFSNIDVSDTKDLTGVTTVISTLTKITSR